MSIADLPVPQRVSRLPNLDDLLAKSRYSLKRFEIGNYPDLFGAFELTEAASVAEIVVYIVSQQLNWSHLPLELIEAHFEVRFARSVRGDYYMALGRLIVAGYFLYLELPNGERFLTPTQKFVDYVQPYLARLAR